jgi:hypothetical protein
MSYLLCVKKAYFSLISDQSSHFGQLKSLISHPSRLLVPNPRRILLLSETRQAVRARQSTGADTTAAAMPVMPRFERRRSEAWL